ncbi:KpsF/GutQ family sugar-phosphate isomerase [soil metagenome]
MSDNRKILTLARKTLDIEAEAVSGLKTALDKDFAEAVKIILHMKGRVIVSGIGKSAIIASKIVATFNSTGTPAIFMHAADAIHGDLGMVQKGDVVIVISNSGNTPEIKVLVPLIRSGGYPLIAMAGNKTSYLAEHADYLLDTSVKKEACPNNLAPTSSTTAQLAMGDALAVCLLDLRGFTSEDFARYHPGGALGKRLYLKVDDLWENNAKPAVSPNATVNEVILEISSNRLGCTAVIEKKKLLGIITDGDLRRMMQSGKQFDKLRAKDIMTKNPKQAEKDMMAVEALQMMKASNITALVVTDKEKFLGFVHLHDLLREGIL